MKCFQQQENHKTVGSRKRAIQLLPLWVWSFFFGISKNAACDVVYSDYIRLVNSYLPDVYNPKKFFVADVLTRIPVNYLGRIINVQFSDFPLLLTGY